MAARKTIYFPAPADVEQAKISSQILSDYADPGQVQLIIRGDGGDSDDFVLSGQLLQILLDVFSDTAKGCAISLTSYHHQELSTQEAANLLNVARPFLVGLLEKGNIPFRKVGAHRRVLLRDVLVYQESTDHLRTRALDELAALSQGWNLGY